MLLKCVRVFVAEEFDSCLSLQRADDSRAHKRRTARAREANPVVFRMSECVRLFLLYVRVCAFIFILGHSIRVVVVSFSSVYRYIANAAHSTVDPRTLVEVVVRRPRVVDRTPASDGRTEAGRARWRVGFTARCTANRW